MDALDFMGFSSMRDSKVVVIEKISSHFTCRLDASRQSHAFCRKEKWLHVLLSDCVLSCLRSKKSQWKNE